MLDKIGDELRKKKDELEMMESASNEVGGDDNDDDGSKSQHQETCNKLSKEIESLTSRRDNLYRTSQPEAKQSEAKVSRLQLMAQREADYREERRKFDDMLSDIDQKNLQIMKDMKSCSKEESESLEQAVKGLEMSLRSLGKVTARFHQAQMFWERYASYCLDLGKCDAMECEELEDDITIMLEDNSIEEAKQRMGDTIIRSAMEWYALGQICLIAHNSNTKAHEGNQELFENLPTGNFKERTDYLIGRVQPMFESITSKTSHQ